MRLIEKYVTAPERPDVRGYTVWAMGFALRPPLRLDLDWCQSIEEDGFERRPALLSQLPRMWRRLLDEEAISMIQIEDQSTGVPVAFGAGVIVSDECAASARTRTEPNLAVSILERELTAAPWILRPKQVPAVNHPRHGVNLVILHYSEVLPERPFAELQAVRDLAVGELLRTQRGYALREFLMEFYGVEDLPFMTRMGAIVRTDYASYFAAGAPLPRPARRPFLLGLSDKEMEQQWGAPLAMLFSKEDPRIFFTLRQQQVLNRAVRTPTPTDPEIARELGLQPSTLRDHWRAMFARVAALQVRGRVPTIGLPHFSDRSADLRAALLTYVNEHPCELRPADERYFAASRSAAGASAAALA